jgi:acetamidase/formamidase
VTDRITCEPVGDELAYTFGGRPLVIHLHPGDVVRVSTEDRFGPVCGVEDLPSQVFRLPYVNPVSGLFYVKGAEPGDTLAIRLATITPARDRGVSATFPHVGALTSTHTIATTPQPPLPERVWRHDIDLPAGIVRSHARSSDATAEPPLEAMHGTVGVTFAGFQAIATITAAVATPWRRIESDQAICSVGAARPPEYAYRIAVHDLVSWVADLTGLDTLDAHQMVPRAGAAPIGTVCDPAYTIAAKLPKACLPTAAPYPGIHQRLRRLAAEHTATGGSP